MPNQFISKATRTPLSFLLVCVGLYFAAHSFFAALFLGYLVFVWVKKSIRNSLHAESEAESKSQPGAVSGQPKSAESATAPVTPIRRQYAKSSVVAPFKTGTDEQS